MILAVDVHYVGDKGFIAGVAFDDWASREIRGDYVSMLQPVEEYISGQFYRRELPCILHLLSEHDISPEVIVVDGFVFLDGVEKPGLGKYLFDTLGGGTVVVGVAKNSLSDNDDETYAVYRGESQKPLYVTCAGLDVEEAKECVAAMYGDYRTPAMLKRADRLCRDFAFRA